MCEHLSGPDIAVWLKRHSPIWGTALHRGKDFAVSPFVLLQKLSLQGCRLLRFFRLERLCSHLLRCRRRALPATIPIRPKADSLCSDFPLRSVCSIASTERDTTSIIPIFFCFASRTVHLQYYFKSTYNYPIARERGLLITYIFYVFIWVTRSY